jgi:hypothetical protein
MNFTLNPDYRRERDNLNRILIYTEEDKKVYKELDNYLGTTIPMGKMD